MSHKVFVAVMHDQNISSQDNSVMITFPRDNFNFQIVVRPKFIEANGIKELRTKIIAEIDAKLGYIPGMASAVATGETPITPIKMDALNIEGPSAGEDSLFLDLGK